MLLYNGTLEVELGEAPLPLRYRHKATGKSLDGIVDRQHGAPVLNATRTPWEEWAVSSSGGPLPRSTG